MFAVRVNGRNRLVRQHSGQQYYQPSYVIYLKITVICFPDLLFTIFEQFPSDKEITFHNFKNVI